MPRYVLNTHTGGKSGVDIFNRQTSGTRGALNISCQNVDAFALSLKGKGGLMNLKNANSVSKFSVDQDGNLVCGSISSGVLSSNGGASISTGGLDLFDGARFRPEQGRPGSIAGDVTLSNGLATVETAAAGLTANGIQYLLTYVSSGSGTLGILSVGTIVDGVSFVINGRGITNNATVSWMVIG